jgi:hypothetical protein
MMSIKRISIVGLALGLAPLALGDERAVIPVGVDFGVFFPTDTSVRSTFGSAWWRIGLSPLSFQKPEKWTGTFDIGYLRRSNATDSVTLIPITFGVTRAFGPKADARPYVAFRVGPYWGDVNSPSFGVDKSKFGFDANASIGVTFQQRFYIEGRYDYFSDFDGIKFSGFFINAGVRLFDIKL